MKKILACLNTVLFVLFVPAALANTEKTIFIAPAPIILHSDTPSLEHLRLDTLSAANSTLSTALRVAFPTKDNPQGRESWYLLQDLNEGQRYETRICWAAVQPTELWLDVYNITHVFDTPHLIQSLATFVDDHLLRAEQPTSPQPNDLSGSVLFLHVRAAADYFTTNKTLMQHPPLVDVNIILDPYLANVFPASLLPTAAYIIVLAIGAWFASGTLWNFLQPTQTRKERKD